MNRTHTAYLQPKDLADLQSLFNDAWRQLLAEYAQSGLQPDETMRDRLAKLIYAHAMNENVQSRNVTALALQTLKSEPDQI